MSLHPTLNYTLTANDVLHVCPYDKSHQVLAPRLCRHLVICRKAYLKKCGGKEPDMQICRWNSNHHHPSARMQTHELECPDRETMTDFVKYHADPQWKIPGPSPSVARTGGVSKKDPTSYMDDEEEDWEPKPKAKEDSQEENLKGPKALAKDEIPDTGYNPSLRLMTEAIIYTPQGLTKSELKAHRKAEHERWKKLKSNPMVPAQSTPEPEGAVGGKDDEDERDEDWDSEDSFPDTDPEED